MPPVPTAQPSPMRSMQSDDWIMFLWFTMWALNTGSNFEKLPLPMLPMSPMKDQQSLSFPPPPLATVAMSQLLLPQVATGSTSCLPPWVNKTTTPQLLWPYMPQPLAMWSLNLCTPTHPPPPWLLLWLTQAFPHGNGAAVGRPSLCLLQGLQEAGVNASNAWGNNFITTATKMTGFDAEGLPQTNELILAVMPIIFDFCPKPWFKFKNLLPLSINTLLNTPSWSIAARICCKLICMMPKMLGWWNRQRSNRYFFGWLIGRVIRWSNKRSNQWFCWRLWWWLQQEMIRQMVYLMGQASGMMMIRMK